MSNRLSIRSYTNKARDHAHPYHQLVLPLHGSIELNMCDYQGVVSAGECIVVRASERHDFSANSEARFIVADMDELPTNLADASIIKFSINAPLLAYIQYVEKQLIHRVDATLEAMTFELFTNLLAQQTCSNSIDPRIDVVIATIQQDLSHAYSIEELSKMAFLSATQYKKVFKLSMGMSTQAYITKLRMHKAKTLLTHTDLPVQIVAEQVGYQNLSAFSRRFTHYFSQSPRSFHK